MGKTEKMGKEVIMELTEKDGKNGLDGKDGKKGEDGNKGADGLPGPNGDKVKGVVYLVQYYMIVLLHLFFQLMFFHFHILQI